MDNITNGKKYTDSLSKNDKAVLLNGPTILILVRREAEFCALSASSSALRVDLCVRVERRRRRSCVGAAAT
eukprot:5455124-Pyramimonas_sp.AAC.1